MFKSLAEKTYEVGGSLRNAELGKPANDIDFVVEATEVEFEAEFPDAKRVGETFPVYLIDGFEVALTRKEESTGDKYQDFALTAIGVSIHEDLARRDFTMNSIAKHVVTGEIVDPFDGKKDIRDRLVRTVNDDFMKDDPLRAFRLARFVSEFDFTIEAKTAAIIKRDKEQIKRVLPERIFEELKKAYKRSPQPSVFFRVLFHLEILKYHFPYFVVAAGIPAGPSQYHSTKSVFDHLLDAFDAAKYKGHSFDVAVASLHHDLGKILTKKDILPHHYGHEARGHKLLDFIEKHHRFTAKQIELSRVSGFHHMKFHTIEKTKSPIKLVRFFKGIKKYVDEVIQVADNDHELSATQHKILADLKRTFKETVIDVPKETLAKGKEAVVAFVEQKYAAKYKEITK
jgi:tRNA nucleotidyltransferase (CCA-adding enzyme)